MKRWHGQSDEDLDRAASPGNLSWTLQREPRHHYVGGLIKAFSDRVPRIQVNSLGRPYQRAPIKKSDFWGQQVGVIFEFQNAIAGSPLARIDQ